MAWKDFSELAPQLTQGEINFEKKKRLVGLILGPLGFAVCWFLTPLPHVTPLGMRSLAIFCWAVIWWITEAVPIPVTSLLLLPLIAVCGLFPYEKALGYWGHWTNLFLFGAFLIGHAMEKYGLTRRVSLTLVASRLVRGRPWRLLVLFLLANIGIGAFTSNAVDAILFTSIGIGLLRLLSVEPGSSFGTAMFLGIAWATNIGGKLTPSGSVPNMVAVGLAAAAGYRIGYAQWFIANLPFTILQTVAMLCVLRLFLSRKDQEYVLPTELIRDEVRKLGPFSRGEKIACAALATALTLWILPDILPLLLGRTHPLAVWSTTRLNWGVVALLVGGSLFVIPIDWKARKFVITWDEAMKNIEWGTMVLISGGIALGDLIVDKRVGLGELFSAGVARIAGGDTPSYLVIFGIILITVVLSQVTSGVAIVSAMGAIALVVAPTLRLNPIALLVTISLAANMGYTLPSSTPPNAIVFSSGYVRIVPMFLRGSILALIGIILLSLTGYSMANWVFPWPPPSG